jgi:lysozyme family protein
MIDLHALTLANAQRWQHCRINPDLTMIVRTIAGRLVGAKPRYQAVESRTGVPWCAIAVIHQRESSQSWLASLAQGDPWNKISIHVPAHRGPFPSWEAAAVDALEVCPPHAAAWHDWTIGGLLCLLEQYNGLGYANRGLPSPYVWASTNQYTRGKYIADGHFDPNVVDHQLGCASLLSMMMTIDPTIISELHP